jgi:hypothetical protein
MACGLGDKQTIEQNTAFMQPVDVEMGILTTENDRIIKMHTRSSSVRNYKTHSTRGKLIGNMRLN